ncbi:MAG TPA: c-type cytochrome [Burkholderiaceae bacterium]|jgi:cytochrome c553
MKRLLQISFVLAAILNATGAHAQNAEAGKGKVAMCQGCHSIIGYQASFPEVYKVPMIAGQNPKYLVAALGEYAKGERRHPTMRGIAGSLTETDMADVAAYYEQLGKSVPTPAQPDAAPTGHVADLLKKGNCASCHGANYSKPLTGMEPKLAGQHADYLFAALKSYQTTGNNLVGRSNAIMAGQVKGFNHAELKEIADYLSTLPSELHSVPESRFR